MFFNFLFRRSTPIYFSVNHKLIVPVFFAARSNEIQKKARIWLCVSVLRLFETKSNYSNKI